MNLRICACVQHSSSPSGRTAQAQTGIHELETRLVRQQCWKNSCMDFNLRTSAVFGFIHAESKDQHNPDCRLHAPARAPLHWTRTSTDLSLNCTWKLSTISRSFSNTGVCRCAPTVYVRHPTQGLNLRSIYRRPHCLDDRDLALQRKWYVFHSITTLNLRNFHRQLYIWTVGA